MKWRDWLEKWGLAGLRVNVGVLAAEFAPQDRDRYAAWDLYVELLTRVATQPLPDADGDEATALATLHALFAETRTTLKAHGPGCDEATRIAVLVLNQFIRPVTARWHKRMLAQAFEDPAQCLQFRSELRTLQECLRAYMRALADMAGVEDMTRLEETGAD